MASRPAGVLRFLLAWVCLQVISACGDDTLPPQPAPERDTTAPTTQATQPGGTFTSAVSVTLTCADAGGSGCEATYYTTDGSTPTKSSPRYSAPLSLEATTTLRFFSVDVAGNAESVKAETYTMTLEVADTTAPTVSASPAGGTYNTAQSVTLTCTDGTGTGCQAIRYTTNGSTPAASSTAYTAPIAVSANTTLKFFATDAAGNASAVVSETYVLDTTPPTVSASPTGGTYASARTVKLTCTDGSGTGCAAIHYTTDGSTPDTNAARYTESLSIGATTTLRFIGVDNAGNVSAVKTEEYLIDTTPPTTTISPEGGVYSEPQTVVLSCNHGPVGECDTTYYTLDGSTPDTNSPEANTPLYIEVTTTVKYFSMDTYGNREPVQSQTFVITQ
ncbi:chitobiase/beta-hexosaminidase C-terminal domain-containing protein [Hyalangium rubrum]|uniref:Chitobiase/beta-hexosaminidase C-terminal domain-containing protein n=1 Tax=Hyalangium rubrum TaxID=3103134 RepID=A0ABU5HF96_9BACT|nr:chitobiase/beta-hexosaminidase C-terminal domain-containing protein [Hyalangium sp. s54d21]MDY7232145.1 chitobiase/beta-hexosaminidase C-terminal domain-containing protein [Hyalangium sp. s54d21]